MFDPRQLTCIGTQSPLYTSGKRPGRYAIPGPGGDPESGSPSAAALVERCTSRAVLGLTPRSYRRRAGGGREVLSRMTDLDDILCTCGWVHLACAS